MTQEASHLAHPSRCHGAGTRPLALGPWRHTVTSASICDPATSRATWSLCTGSPDAGARPAHQEWAAASGFTQPLLVSFSWAGRGDAAVREGPPPGHGKDPKRARVPSASVPPCPPEVGFATDLEESRIPESSLQGGSRARAHRRPTSTMPGTRSRHPPRAWTLFLPLTESETEPLSAPVFLPLLCQPLTWQHLGGRELLGMYSPLGAVTCTCHPGTLGG